MPFKSRKNWGRLGSAVVVLGLAPSAVSGPAAADPSKVIGYSFLMYGDQVVPGPGDPEGHTDGNLASSDPRTGRICFHATHTDTIYLSDSFTAGHVHEGEPGTAGPVVVSLFEETRTAYELEDGVCVTADPKVTRAIFHHPEDYYVDLHNTEFPDGAVRGQVRGCDRTCPSPTAAEPPARLSVPTR